MCAGTLAEDRDIVRIAAKGCDIVANPGEGCDLVEQAVIARHAARIICTQRRVRDIAEHTQAIIDGDQNHAILDQLVGLIDLLRPRTGLMAAAMNPDHDRLQIRAANISAADVQEQAIFAFLWRRRALQHDGGKVALYHVQSKAIEQIVEKLAAARTRLDTLGAKHRAISHAVPSKSRLRCAPAQVADRRRGEWNTIDLQDVGIVAMDSGLDVAL